MGKTDNTYKRDEKSIFRKGESRRANGDYNYRWTDEDGKHRSIYAKTLEALREEEDRIAKGREAGLKTEARYVTVNDMFELWVQLKRGLKDNTFQNYQYMYRMFVEPDFGQKRISGLRKSDVKRFYNTLVDERGLAVSTVDSVHTVLHQVLDMALDDAYIRSNPSDNVLRELKQAHAFGETKRHALAQAEQDLFLNYLKGSEQYRHWYPIFAVMVGTGMRVGEATGLRWCDIDLEAGIIDINHTVVYYRHENGRCHYNIHRPKTKSGTRKIPMLDAVRRAFMEERRNQIESGIRCNVTVDGYTDFIFLNRNGQNHHQGTLNKALRRIIRDCNYDVLSKNMKRPVLLPHFSCHTLRHTFTTRMCEAGVNVKVIQDTLGHSDVSTTLNIYTDVTHELQRKEFDNFERYIMERTRL